MTKIRIVAFSALLALLALTAATPAQEEPDKAPVGPPVPAQALQTLKNLQGVPEKYKTFQAQYLHATRNMVEGTADYRWGPFLASVEKDPETSKHQYKFAVQFKAFAQEDGPKTADRQDWAFDGQWITNVKHKAKQMLRIQVAAGKAADNVFRIGEGPIVMPIGQKPEDVIETFEVHNKRPGFLKALADFERKDVSVQNLPDARYLLLVTREKYKNKINYVMVELWIDPKTDLPMQMVAYKGDHAGLRGIKEVTYGRFEDYKLDEQIDPAVFTPPTPTSPGWKVDIERLKKPAAQAE